MTIRSSRRHAFALHAIATWLLVGSSTACSTGVTGHLPLASVTDAPLTGRTTRWDYASLDPASHRLYLAHLGDSIVTVFDTQAQKVVTDIHNVSHVHGVLFVPELDRVYASATGTDEVVAIDPKTLTITARVPAGDYPDGMAYAPDVHKLYVSDEHGGTDTVIDTRTNKRIATIPLGGDVGNTQYDPITKHIFANVQTRKQLVEIDPVTDKVISRTDLPGAKGNHGLYIDPKTHLAFIACEDNDKLLVFDLVNRRVVQTFDVAKDPDVLGFDTALDWLYVAGESDQVSMFKVQGHAITLLGTAVLGPNAHVVAVDSASHYAYFPLKNLAGKPQLRIMQAKP
ncbi:YncE family protein [Dyella sp. 2HG41-7]|uniref:YncE family protein n=1 Tax=Dyella sp. 2HG41-7 TaxID=2883239 RepID=UPI001F48D7C6|nr:YncE family protein [Dyella sp. 2HG41-7]